MHTSGSAQGISAKMLEIYFLLHCCRLYAIVPFEGYLPFDKSGDWFYQANEVFACMSGGTEDFGAINYEKFEFLVAVLWQC